MALFRAPSEQLVALPRRGVNLDPRRGPAGVAGVDRPEPGGDCAGRYERPADRGTDQNSTRPAGRLSLPTQAHGRLDGLPVREVVSGVCRTARPDRTGPC